MISIIIPSIGRNERLHKMLGLIEAEITSDAEIIVVMDLFEETTAHANMDRECLIAMHPKANFITTNVRGCWRCTNIGIEAAKYDFIMWTADDAMPHSGWFWNGVEAFRCEFPDGLGLLILNDLAMRDQVAGHAMTTKRFLTVLFAEPKFPEAFNHLFCDTMTADWARSIGQLSFCENSIMEHMHWMFGKSERDATNIMCESWTGNDKGYKDSLDEIWYKGGGKEAAIERLIAMSPEGAEQRIKRNIKNLSRQNSFAIHQPEYKIRPIFQGGKQHELQSRQKKQRKNRKEN